MAEPDKAIITYTDQAGEVASSTHYNATGLTLAQITEGLQGLAQLIDDVTGALITAVTAIFAADISGLTGNTPGVTGDREEVGEFLFSTTLGRKVVVNIPAIVTTLSVAGSDNIDQTDSDVAAFISMMEDGLTTPGGTMIPCDVAEDDIVSVLTARERVRNSGSRR